MSQSLRQLCAMDVRKNIFIKYFVGGLKFINLFLSFYRLYSIRFCNICIQNFFLIWSKEIDWRSLSGERFKTIFNMHRIEKTQGLHRVHQGLPSALGKFYKQFVQNISYFNKEKIFIIKEIQTIDRIKYYWLETNRKLSKRFMRIELFALKNNFLA